MTDRNEKIWYADDGNAKVEIVADTVSARTEDAWWAWHDADEDRWSDGEDPHEATRDAEERCALWVAGESDDGPAVQTVVQCACGEWFGAPCAWSGPPTETVVVEVMPTHLRASHEAAGNSGTYPVNGALRLRVAPSCADILVEDDGDWAWVVQASTATGS